MKTFSDRIVDGLILTLGLALLAGLLFTCGCASAKQLGFDKLMAKKPVVVGSLGLPDGTLAPVVAPRKTVSKVLTKLPANLGSISFIGHAGVDYALARTNGVLFVTPATNLFAAPFLLALKSSPAPERLTILRTAALVAILPVHPGQSISYGEWEPGTNYAYVVTTNLVSGQTYKQQATVDLVNWSFTGNNVTWSSPDPNAFWGTIRLGPEGFPHEFYRIVTP